MYSLGNKMESKKILFVDDQSMICNLGKIVLESVGYKVETASNGKEGFDAYHKMQKESSLPDIVVTDFNMPEANGEYLIDQIRAVNKDQKIILACSQDNDLVKGLLSRYNLSGILAKPYRNSQLIKKIEEVLKQ